MNIGKAMEPRVAIGLEPKNLVIGASSEKHMHAWPHLYRLRPESVSFQASSGIRCQRVPMHLRQELGKEWHEENAAYDGILSAFTNAARNYRSTVMEANVLRTPGFSALRVEIKLGQPEAKRSVSSQEHPKRIP